MEPQINIYRGESKFSIGPFHSLFEEEIDIGSHNALFSFEKSRLLNPKFCSKSNFTSAEFELDIVSRFKVIRLHVKGAREESFTVTPPFLFPFFSVGDFNVNLDEGCASLTIARKLDKAGQMFGKVFFEGNDYRYFYKFKKYRTTGLTRLFPDGLPSCFSRKSIILVSYLAIWLNAYNADYRNS